MSEDASGAADQSGNDDGQSDDDVDAQNALAQAAADGGDDGDDDSDEGLDAKAKAKIDKANREARNLRQKLRELEPDAKRWREADEAQKSELQKTKDRLAEAEMELKGHQVDQVRRKAASNAGLDPELAEFITATDDDEALEQAQKLAKRVGTNSTNTSGGDTSGRGPDLRQGASRGSAPKQPESRDDLIRRWAGVN